MAMTPPQFFEKNMKWFALGLLLLFLFKSVQSCNRNMGATIKDKNTAHVIDSLTKKYNTYYSDSQDTIKFYKFQVKLLESERDAEKSKNLILKDQNDAVRSVAEKVRNNTTSTIVLKGVEQVQDTTIIK